MTVQNTVAVDAADIVERDAARKLKEDAAVAFLVAMQH